MNKTKFIFGSRDFYQPPKPFECDQFTLTVKGVLLIVTFKTGRENLYIDLSKLVKIELSEHDPNWLCVYVIGKRDGRIKELQFNCKDAEKAVETKYEIIRMHRESTKCSMHERIKDVGYKDPEAYESYGWGEGQFKHWKHFCYLCARETENKEIQIQGVAIKRHPFETDDIENQITEFRTHRGRNEMIGGYTPRREPSEIIRPGIFGKVFSTLHF